METGFIMTTDREVLAELVAACDGFWGDDGNKLQYIKALAAARARLALPEAVPLPRRGLVVLKNAIQLLRESCRFVDEEGDDTNALEELLEALAQGVHSNDEREPPELSMSMFASKDDLTEARGAAWADSMLEHSDTYAAGKRDGAMEARGNDALRKASEFAQGVDKALAQLGWRWSGPQQQIRALVKDLLAALAAPQINAPAGTPALPSREVPGSPGAPVNVSFEPGTIWSQEQLDAVIAQGRRKG